jgi:hypothetical protein
MRRALGVAGMVLLGEIGLLRRESMFAINSRPRNGGVTAAEELLIDGFMAAATIRGRQMLGDDESVVLVAFLIGGRLMAFETTNPLHGMDAHLVPVDDAVLQAIVALRALSRSANQRCIRLRGLGTRPRPVYKKSTDGQCEAKDNGDKDVPESRHVQKSTVIGGGELDVPVVHSASGVIG